MLGFLMTIERKIAATSPHQPVFCILHSATKFKSVISMKQIEPQLDCLWNYLEIQHFLKD